MQTRTVRRAFVAGLAMSGLVLGAMPGLAQTQTQTQQQQTRTKEQRQTQAWDRQAEQSFMLGRGMGRQLMTQEEWARHVKKMQSMTAEERQQYRQEMHAKMQERAKEKGITLPDMPRGPMSGAPGGGAGKTQ